MVLRSSTCLKEEFADGTNRGALKITCPLQSLLFFAILSYVTFSLLQIESFKEFNNSFPILVLLTFICSAIIDKMRPPKRRVLKKPHTSNMRVYYFIALLLKSISIAHLRNLFFRYFAMALFFFKPDILL